jgi:hypothetical protein
MMSIGDWPFWEDAQSECCVLERLVQQNYLDLPLECLVLFSSEYTGDFKLHGIAAAPHTQTTCHDDIGIRTSKLLEQEQLPNRQSLFKLCP